VFGWRSPEGTDGGTVAGASGDSLVQITEAARTLFDQKGLFPREAWQRQYAVVEKTARIRDVEQMPRPRED
jgi:hypothetical protein